MPHDAHDVALLPGLVASIVHRLAIHRQGLVVDTAGLIPGIEGLIQGLRSKAYQAIANDKFAGHDRVSVFTPTAEAFAGFLSHAIGPVGDRLVPAHTAQGSPRRDAQHHRQAHHTVSPIFGSSPREG